MATRMQQRRGTAAQWTAANPTLAAGEFGFETDTNKFKVGNGSSAWSSLTYFVDGSVAFDETEVESLIDAAVADLVGNAPNALNTIWELANAINGDANFAYTVTQTIGGLNNNISLIEVDVETIQNSIVDLGYAIGNTTADLGDLTSNTASSISDAIDTAAEYTTNSITTHNADTTNVHGIANTAALAYTANVDAAKSEAIEESENYADGLISALTKSSVGLSNVDNTSDANKPVSTATQTALDLKAPLNSPTFTGTVTLPNNTISQSMMSDDSVGTNEIVGLAVTEGKIASSAVTEGKIASSAVTEGKIADGAVTSAKIADGTIVNADISASAAIAQSKIANLTSDLAAKASLSGAVFTGSVEIDQDLVVDGNFTVNGSNIIVSATQIQIEDTMIQLGHTNSGNSTDLGLFASYNDGTQKHTGLVKDVSDSGKWKLFDGVTTEPGTTVNFTQGSLDSLVVNGLEATTLSVGNVSNTEIGYLDGVTSNVQAQLNNKAPLASPTFTGTVTLPNGTVTHDMIANGTIIDADINASAAIAQSKISGLTSDLAAKAPLAGPTFTGLVTVAANGIAFTDGTQIAEGVPSRTVIIQRTSSNTLSGVERDDLIEMASASAMTLTIPADSTFNFPIGTSMDVLQTSTGQVTIAGAAGVTVNATPGLKLRTQWSSATLFKRAANTWVVYGDLMA